MVRLTLGRIRAAAADFAEVQNRRDDPALYGVTDGKAIGTYLERRFTSGMQERYTFKVGSSSRGIDFPDLELDIKTTSVRQPQSSCPFESAYQKIYGLGYHLLVFVYEKTDDEVARIGRLRVIHAIFVHKSRTADFQMTRGIREIIENAGNEEDIQAFLLDRNLPVDDVEAMNMAQALLSEPPRQGYLTVSNALQWRLQYGRAIAQAGTVDGILRMR